MKKIVIAVVVALLALGLGTGIVAARSLQTPNIETGPIHDYIEQALADKLGIPLATVEEQFDAGETLAQIALDNGVAQEDLPEFMQEVHEAAFAAAQADGVITQTQADRMLQRMNRMGYGYANGSGNGYGDGDCPMGGTRPQDGSGMRFGNGAGMMQRAGR